MTYGTDSAERVLLRKGLPEMLACFLVEKHSPAALQTLTATIGAETRARAQMGSSSAADNHRAQSTAIPQTGWA